MSGDLDNVFDLSKFAEDRSRFHPDKPPTVSIADWEAFISTDEETRREERLSQIGDTGTESATFHAGPLDGQRRIVPRGANEVILPGCFADSQVADGTFRTDWPGMYRYRRFGTLAKFIYAGPTPQPEEGKPRLIVP
jgi:hypothetical protein